MTHKKVSQGYIVKFTQKEKLIHELKQFIFKQKIKSAWLNGLGAAAGATLGFYDIENQLYEWHDYTSLAEITNLTGNVSWHNEDPVIHLHGTFTGKDMQAYGGHVKELIVGGTCEMLIITNNHIINRKHDDTTGLNTLEL